MVQLPLPLFPLHVLSCPEPSDTLSWDWISKTRIAKNQDTARATNTQVRAPASDIRTNYVLVLAPKTGIRANHVQVLLSAPEIRANHVRVDRSTSVVRANIALIDASGTVVRANEIVVDPNNTVGRTATGQNQPKAFDIFSRDDPLATKMGMSAPTLRSFAEKSMRSAAIIESKQWGVALGGSKRQEYSHII